HIWISTRRWITASRAAVAVLPTLCSVAHRLPHELLTLWQDRGRASADLKALARQHIDELNQKIRELGQLRDTLQDLVEHCQGDHRPDCPILKELASGSCCT
ncbi:MerR family DNA-binding protein, partial [Pseudomonas sp. SDO5561_S422]